MRCPSCGTENAPDSRFCGGCGAKLTPATGASPKVAPTAKIPDDATFPAPQSVQTGQRAQIPQGYQSGPPSIPPTANPYAATGPASIPPTASKGPASIPPHASFQRAPTPAPIDASMSGRPTPLAPGLRPGSQGLGAEPAFASMPPTQQRKPVRASTPLPDGSMPGDSLVAPAQRPLGLIAIVLVVDLALCGAGAVMLSKGLSAKKHKDEPGTPKAPEQKMQQRSEVMPPPSPPAPAPAPAPAPSGSPSEAVAAAAPPPIADAKPDTKVVAAADKLVESKADKQARAKDSKKKGSTTASSASKSGGGGASTGGSSTGPVTHPGGGSPEDPYKDQGQPAPAASGFDLKAESNKQAAQSSDLFARCVSAGGGVHGTIKVAYRVEADGRVVHPYAVENSTGNEQLGICLADVIATWHFSPHTGEAQNAVRPFTY